MSRFPILLAVSATLVATGCGKPDPIKADPGQPCHLGDGWKNCDGACLDADASRRLEEQKHPETAPKAPDQPTVTTERGSSADLDMDCYGFMKDKCVAIGTCVARVAIGEPCVSNEMCESGSCIGDNRDEKGNLEWRCRAR
ncbi:MAG: hypothetical protein R3B72_06820 [Polyangiaceae bacterium]